MRNGLRTRSLEDELRFGSSLLLEFGHYEEQLRRYISQFGREQVLVLHYEELLASPAAVLATVLQFLGVDEVAVRGHSRVLSIVVLILYTAEPS